MGVLLGKICNYKCNIAKLAHKRDGSVTLEAALAVPLLLTFVLTLIAFVELAQSEAGLRSAVYQASQQLAVQAYPLEMLGNTLEKQDVVQKLISWKQQYDDGKVKANEWLEEYGPLMPKSVRDGMLSALQTADRLEEQLSEPIRQAFHPLVAHYLPDHMDADRLHITKLHYPVVLANSGEHYVLLEATYEVPVIVPFLNRTITLRAAAQERMWIGRR